MAGIKEVVRVGREGAEITLNLSEEEHAALLEFAVNELIARGMMVLGDTKQRNILIGTEEGIEHMVDAEQKKEVLN